MFACTANNDNLGRRLVNNRLVLLVNKLIIANFLTSTLCCLKFLAQVFVSQRHLPEKKIE